MTILQVNTNGKICPEPTIWESSIIGRSVQVYAGGPQPYWVLLAVGASLRTGRVTKPPSPSGMCQVSVGSIDIRGILPS